jgi:citrate lyase subunit beta / citryl-CoA lyase
MRLRRSALFMPASNARALERARGLAADVVIFDLEDAVAPEAKATARAAAVSAASSGAYGPREILIRVNAWGSDHAEADLRAAALSGADGVLLPKVEDARTVIDAAALLAPTALRLWCMIETPRGVLAAAAIAAAHPRMAGLVVGTNDLAADLALPPDSDRLGLITALSLIVLAARAHGLAVLDGVHPDVTDEAGFEAACRQGRRLGFDGKTLIHPRTIETANRVFGPSTEALAQARRVVAAFAEAAGRGEAVTLLDGRLVEALHVAEAQRLLALGQEAEKAGQAPNS